MVTKTLQGPGGLRIELDSAQIFPDDPGQGTPAMVYLLGDKLSATYQWACGEGTVYGDRDVELSQSQINWLYAQEEAVDSFLEEHSPA